MGAQKVTSTVARTPSRREGIRLRGVMVRRIAALATATLLLRLNFVAVDLTCAQHSAAQPAMSEHADGQHHGASGPMDGGKTRADASDSCDVPVRSECCQALASCSVTLGSSSLTQADTAPLDQAAFLALGVDRPASRSHAPDPPPPKV